MIRPALARYTGPTESLLPDPEARHCDDEVSGSSPLTAFPIGEARCSRLPSRMDWVPDRERATVPDPMIELCRACPGRQSCLLWALAGNEQGYWAGTTTRDRQTMRDLDQVSVATADWLHDLARAEEPAPLHPTGDGSLAWYRRQGCRCTECRAANARRRAEERARTARVG